MWVLKRITDGTTKFLISEKFSYSVGRKNCDVVLEDSSISRKHCTIYIAKKENCPFDINTSTGIWIVDEQSKYGTFLNSSGNWVKLKSEKNVKLMSGSILKFGLIENIWSLEYKPIIACTSGIQNNLKKEIENSLKSVDGELKSTWTKECSLVIVNEITLTIKVVLALINGIPIVTSNYVQKLLHSVKNQIALPDYKYFKPEIKESILDASLISLDIERNRKDLFKGKKFVIPTKRQLETLKEIILSAGGKAELLSLDSKWEFLAKKDVIVIQLPLNVTNSETFVKSFKEISKFLKDKYKKRIVPESEIAQAVAYSSIEKYCNPEKAFFTFKRTADELDSGTILVEETPDEPDVEQIIPEQYVIPCTSTVDTPNEILIEENQFSPIRFGIKRNHSPEFEEGKKMMKNAKSSDKQRTSVIPIKSSEKDFTSCPSKRKKLNNLFVTDYFKLQSQSTEPKSLQDKQENLTFWGPDAVNDGQKRKLSTEDDSIAHDHKTKKISLSSNFVNKTTERKVTSEKCTRNSQKAFSGTIKSSVISPCTNNVPDEIEMNYFSDFFEKENTAKCGLDDLNNTIYLSNLISATYLNDDGSLVDPPTILVNVKKFKKQLVYSKGDNMPIQNEKEEVWNEEWLEPHPNLQFCY